MFADLYAQFDGELPALTQQLIYISEAIKNYWWLFLLLTLSTASIIYFLRKKDWLINAWFQFLFFVPLFGKIIQKFYLTLFCNAMALLTSSGVSLVEALNLSSKIIKVPFLKNKLSEVQTDVIQGLPLYTALGKIQFFGKRIPALIKVGEETGQLPKMFSILSNEFQEEASHQSEVINTLIEPLIIIVLGVVIGIVLIALYLPIFNITDQLGV